METYNVEVAITLLVGMDVRAGSEEDAIARAKVEIKTDDELVSDLLADCSYMVDKVRVTKNVRKIGA